jgi:hypothetical protein
MAELEQLLHALTAEVEWPETPDVTGRLRLEPRRRSRRRLLLVAVAAALLAIAVALAVPTARSAILRFFHLGGVTIERVSTLPRAEERPLAADLGRRVSATEAKAVLGAPFRLPRTSHEPALYERAPTVSALLATPEPVLLTETRLSGLMKKLSTGSTTIRRVEVEPGVEGLWLSGARHVYLGPQAPPRLAGNVLLFESGAITYRLEGRTLTRERALELAREILA